RTWLAERPITSIEFHDDFEVRISLAASAPDLWPVLQEALQKHALALQPANPREWEQLQQNVMKSLAPAIGRSLANGPAGHLQSVVIPRDPPAWIAASPLESVGVSGPIGGSKLKTARAAEAVALVQLRSRLEELKLGKEMTLGQAARKDPH